MKRRTALRAPWPAFGLALLAVACATAPRIDTGSPGSQLKFGIQMARQGLWNEALFRFEQARRLDPQNARILNDLAVAYEAAGRYDDAQTAYKDALRVAPEARDIKRNYSRFMEFYQGFKAPPGAAAPGSVAVRPTRSAPGGPR